MEKSRPRMLLYSGVSMITHEVTKCVLCIDKPEFDGGAPVISYTVQGREIREGTQNTCTQCVANKQFQYAPLQRRHGHCLALWLILRRSAPKHSSHSSPLYPPWRLELAMNSEYTVLTKLGSVIFCFHLSPNCVYLISLFLFLVQPPQQHMSVSHCTWCS